MRSQRKKTAKQEIKEIKAYLKKVLDPKMYKATVAIAELGKKMINQRLEKYSKRSTSSTPNRVLKRLRPKS